MSRAPHARGRGRLRGARGARLSRREELAAALRGALLDPEEAERLEAPGRKLAGVLVPLFEDAEGELHAVFTERRAELRRHAGEISFPGGRHDPEDPDLRHTALREAHEEIGLPPERVTVAGALPPTPTFVTDYAIYPVVGVIDAGFAWVLAEAEVGRVLELRLADLRAGHEQRRLVRRGVPFLTDVYEVDGHVIWGATAKILGDLLARVA